MGGFEGGFLGVCGLGLMFGFPLIERHAVEGFPRSHFVDFDAAFGGGFLIPAAEAVPAEAGEVHHVDILHIRAPLQVVAQGAESGGFEF